jgi:hypothetical protein
VILTTRKAEIRRIGIYSQKVPKDPSPPIKRLGPVVHACFPSSQKSINKRIT